MHPSIGLQLIIIIWLFAGYVVGFEHFPDWAAFSVSAIVLGYLTARWRQ